MVATTRKDLAEFFKLAVLNNIVHIASIVRWADRLIEDSDVPDDWEIDLAMAKSVAHVLTALNACDGIFTEGTPLAILMAAIRRKWVSGALPGQEVGAMVWNIGGVEFPPATDIQRSVVIASYEDAEAVAAQLGDCPKTDRVYQRADNAVAQLLSPFEKYDVCIPLEY
jgi:hypothetical protein